MTSAFPCIYCRRLDVPRTREHVLQRAFGASATLPTQVCGDCNAAFSKIDKTFVEVVDFYHRGRNMLRTLGLGQHVLEDGTIVNAVVDGRGEVTFPPQFFEVSGSEWRFFGSSEQERDKMFEELARPSGLTVASRVVPPSPGVPPLLLLRSSPKSFVLIGTSEARVEAFRKSILEVGVVPDSMGTNETKDRGDPPTITFPTKLEFVPYGRAMAKVALNFVCHRLGSEVALREQFDPVRKFILGSEGDVFDFVVPTALNHSLGDSLAPFLTGEQHALALVTADVGSEVRESVLVALSGKTVGRVDLTKGNPGLPEGTWVLTRFDGEERTFTDFALPQDILRAVVNPEPLGLGDLWPHLL